jgi:signal transduction histidine kinase/DNA-binding response OmpR family regulator
LIAQVIWLVSLSLIIVFSLYLFQQPILALLCALLTLVASVTIGWQASLLTEILIYIALWWIIPSVQALPSLSSLRLVILIASAVSGIIGWAVTNTLFTLAVWALYSREETRRKMEDAFEQRLELKETQEDLIQANQELARMSFRMQTLYQEAEEARQAKQRFAANVSHELRTPLNMIIGFSEMIPKLSHVYGVQLPSALLSDIAAIQRNSQHLSHLIDDVLDLSQIEAGRMVINKEWTDLQVMIQEAVVATRILFESKNLYIKMEMAPDLPQVFCDTTRIRQVILNLLSNAGRLTESGGVIIRAWQQDVNAFVSVSDTGPGISPEKQKMLFQPFQQLDSTPESQKGGSGLGLSISKDFIEMHDGKMWVESEIGVGTTFYFNLPIRTVVPQLLDRDNAIRWFNPYESTEHKIRTRRSKAPIPEVTPRFVLLEQGGESRSRFEHYLQYAELIRVTDTKTAEEMLKRSPAQALIVNVAPIDAEYDPVKQLKEIPYNTPIIKCWLPGKSEAIKRLKVLNYLVKPIAYDDLISAVNAVGEHVKKILLVDDKSEALRLFARMLSTADKEYSILQTTSGQRALHLLRERQPDVMLLDLIMPQMDGFEVLELKHKDPTIKDIPVIIISSRDPTGDPIVSNTLSIIRSGGLTGRELSECISAVSQVLSPLETKN